MTQEEVLKVLKKAKKWLGAKEISNAIKFTNSNTIRNNLAKLFNQKLVLRKIVGNGMKKHYGYILK